MKVNSIISATESDGTRDEIKIINEEHLKYEKEYTKNKITLDEKLLKKDGKEKKERKI